MQFGPILCYNFTFYKTMKVVQSRNKVTSFIDIVRVTGECKIGEYCCDDEAQETNSEIAEQEHG